MSLKRDQELFDEDEDIRWLVYKKQRRHLTQPFAEEAGSYDGYYYYPAGVEVTSSNWADVCEWTVEEQVLLWAQEEAGKKKMHQQQQQQQRQIIRVAHLVRESRNQSTTAPLSITHSPSCHLIFTAACATRNALLLSFWSSGDHLNTALGHIN
jgi:hypothetical protein